MKYALLCLALSACAASTPSPRCPVGQFYEATQDLCYPLCPTVAIDTELHALSDGNGDRVDLDVYGEGKGYDAQATVLDTQMGMLCYTWE